ncbi:MAG: GNAT family N-acetyltransferase [Chloroflexi bacterium]|nr:GNAT family N-acetyltransferase [Chloroflexota bacterium]
MQVIEYENAKTFLDDTRNRLMESEAANAIILSYAENQNRGVESAMSTRFYCVTEDDKPLLPAMFTPEVVPLLTEGPGEAARLFARYLFPKNPRIEGVNGPADATLEFADEWERLTRCNLEIRTNLRLYDCIKVANVELAAGHSKQATQDDFELVKHWRQAFRNDVNSTIGTTDEVIRCHINEGRYYLWVTEHPASMAHLAGETVNGGMIGAIYTPPEQREHGYATAVTVAATQVILDRGKKFAILYTNLANPTSNSIYQKIGYKPITDSTAWKFTPAI